MSPATIVDGTVTLNQERASASNAVVEIHEPLFDAARAQLYGFCFVFVFVFFCRPKMLIEQTSAIASDSIRLH